jgi:hypothetical protein
MNKVSPKLVRMALQIVVHRDKNHKINAITLRMGHGHTTLCRVKWKYFSEEAQDYILKKNPLILSSLEVELL